MRRSCNGCRVLRKGCSDSCALRPCLQWIKGSESQENATVFLAKFYGRSGLLNLINSVPEDSRPTMLRSLLYEACGRVVNPTFGSVGLLWSGKWQICQSAVESILRSSYAFRPYNIYRAMSTRLPLRGDRLYNARSEVRFRLPVSTRDAMLGEEEKYLGLLTAHSQFCDLRRPRCYSIPAEFQPARLTKLSRSCTGAESEDIDGLGSRTFHIVSNENSWGNGVDAPDQKGDANDLMGMQSGTQRNSCNKLEIKQDITDLELELRLGYRDCYNSYSCDPTLSHPP